ncbi:MAG: pyridoxal-phosphate dependent enzyme [Alphaproteobacteria bacterium]|nr:pyridoxal-phosphate dependent enzyme [Alphaproteobacteria bacterium]
MKFDVAIADIWAARARIAGQVRATPTYRSEALTRRLGAPTFLKLECLQLAGSFKVRGVLNKLALMGEAERRRGVVTVSGGNHAIAVAQAAAASGIDALVLMPKVTPAYNLAQTRAHGATIELCESSAEAFERAKAHAAAGRVFVHPYDDPAGIAGHGTLGVELVEAVPDLSHVFVSIGGGGFIAGVGAALRALKPDAQLVGVETEGAETMTQALAAGAPVTIQPRSIARTLGAPFATDRTLAAAREFVREIAVVSDEAAVRELDWLLVNERLLAEPAATATIAAAERRAGGFKPADRVVLVICGSNVAIDDIVAWRKQFGVG